MPIPPAEKRPLGPILLLCNSASTLLLLNAWQAILPGSGAQYFGPWAPTTSSVLALVLLQTVITSAIYAIIHVLWSRVHRFLLVRALLILVAILLIQNPLRGIIADHLPLVSTLMLRSWLGHRGFIFMTLLLILAYMAIFWRWPYYVEQVMRGLLLIFSPLPFVLLFSVLLGFQSSDTASQITKSYPGPVPSRQLYLIIFDEWDYGWTFAHRPTGLILPNLDRIVEESFLADVAYPPASETIRSIPSLLSGMLFSSVATAPRQNFRLQVAGSDRWTQFSDLEDLPKIASKLGKRTLLIDYVHSYPLNYFRERPLLDLYRLPYYPDWEKGANGQGTIIRASGYFADLALYSVPVIGGWRRTTTDLPFLRKLLWELKARQIGRAHV